MRKGLYPDIGMVFKETDRIAGVLRSITQIASDADVS
jgi:hypothetical protein